MPVERVTAAHARVLLATANGKKRHKYRAKRTKVDGISFASKLEANRYAVLMLRWRAGEISKPKLQPRFPLIVDGVLVGTYVADFAFDEKVPGKGGHHETIAVVEDAKGAVLDLYKLKRALFRVLYPHLTFREIYQ